jgi:hypothetical protein
MKAKVSAVAALADVKLVLLPPEDHGQARAGPRAPHHRDDNVSRDAHAVLAGSDGDGTGRVGVMVSVVGLCSSC